MSEPENKWTQWKPIITDFMRFGAAINSPDQLTKQRAICMERDCQSKKMYELLKSCEKRVNSKTYTAETCSQEVIDLLEALDHCIGDKAFKEFK